MNNRITRTALLAALYFLCGKLCIYLAVAPGYASPIWPASGVAIGGLYFLGRSSWPGIFFASFLINYAKATQPGALSDKLYIVVLAALVALGASLQAFLGTTWLRRQIPVANKLEKESDVIRILLVCGVLASMISPTIGVSAMKALGFIPWSEFSSNWLTWWVGDSIGVLVFTPVLLLKWLKDKESVTHRHLTIVGLSSALLLFLSTAFFVIAERRDRADKKIHYESQLKSFSSSLRSGLTQSVEALYFLSSSLGRKEYQTAEVFHELSKQMLSKNSQLLYVDWIKPVAKKKRASFEKSMQAYQPGYQIRQPVGYSENSSIDLYFPVAFTEPRDLNLESIGLDMAAHPERMQAIMSSATEGAARCSEVIVNQQVRDGEKSYSFLLFVPVYLDPRKGLHLDNLEGLLAGRIRVSHLVNKSLASLVRRGLYVRIEDTDLGNAESRLLDETAFNGKTKYELASIEEHYRLLGKKWRITLYGDDSVSGTRYAKSMLIAGFAFALITTVFFLLIIGRAKQVRDLVQIRTELLKKALDEVKRTSSLFNSVLDHIPNMIFLKDAQELRFVLFNKAGESLLGTQQKDLIGKNDYDFFQKDQADFFIAKDRQVLAGNAVLDIPEETIQTKNGLRLLHTKKIGIRDVDGVPRYLLGISDDITDRKRSDARIAELQQMLFASGKKLALGEVAGGVVHEINNPLTIINGYAEELEELSSKPQIDREQIAKCSQKILSTVDRMSKIVTGLRSLFSGKVEPFSEVPLREILEEVILLNRGKFASSQVELIVPKISIDVRLECRSVQVSEVLINLINNAYDAVQFAKEKWVRVEVENRKDQVVISVLDSGEGIPETNSDKIFDAFFTTKEPGKGLGLGLSIVKKIVQSHQGDLALTKRQGHTCFLVTLPKRQHNENEESLMKAA